MTAFPWTAKHVTEALGMRVASWDNSYAGVSTDTRSLKERELFVALKGERFDGHDYLSDARMAGVGAVVVRHDTPRWPGFDWFEVDDTLAALGALARHRRDALAAPVVAITGTTGKTSTKELAAAALGARLRVHKSERNLNNLVGVPLTLLAAPIEAEAAVVECGASVPGEIPRLREVVRPDVAVVTTVAEAHLEGFGGLDGVFAEKLALLAGAPTAVVGTVPARLAEAARGLARKVVTAGLEAGADWTAENLTLLPDGRPRFTVRGVTVELPLFGRHMVANALVALAVADALGVPLAEAAGALAGTRLPAGRSEVLELGGATVINDCYNANPSSFAAALDLLAALRGDRRAVVVAGTMRELGAASRDLHRAVAEQIVAAKPDVVVAVGEFAPAFESLKSRLKKQALVTGDTPEAAAGGLRELLRPGDVVLLKASRGVQLERVIPLLWPSAPPPPPPTGAGATHEVPA
ncbi:MAG TPA: UDP-N-acetylmuramoyl-tripeptide--D-alanyl-D-alanine ligase [Gemmatimonadales bacterium]|nr:UDP-N-acetylmuramoyl-tripeptide--D-alanyl-D-alanine ligase [Gemmatimonadales bacterium]